MFVSTLVGLPAVRTRFMLPMTEGERLRAEIWINLLCRCIWIVLSALAYSATNVPAFAIDRDRRLDPLLHTAWTAREGAPTHINELGQTADGYLWLATARGLVRFDGIRFEPYQPRAGQELPKSNIQHLITMPGGGLLLCYNSGGASLLKDDKITNFVEADGLLPSPFLGLSVSRRGIVWANLYNGALVRYEGRRWTVVGLDWNITGKIERLFMDYDDTVWVTISGQLFYLRDNERSFHRTNQTGRVFNTTRSGTIWIAQAANTGKPAFSVSWSREEQKTFMRLSVRLSGLKGVVTTDNSDSIWLADTSGLIRISYPEGVTGKGRADAIQRFTKKDGLTSDYVASVFEDREGNFWVATNAGLDRFRQGPFSGVAVPSGFTNLTLSEREKGGVWLSAWKSSSLLRIRNGRVDGAIPSGRGIVSAYRDADGGVWMGKSEPGELLQLRGDSIRAQKIPIDYALTEVTKDSLGRLWVLFAGNNFFRRDGTQWTKLASFGAPTRGALNAHSDSRGGIWFGFRNNRVVLLEGEKAKVLTEKDGIGVGMYPSSAEATETFG